MEKKENEIPSNFSKGFKVFRIYAFCNASLLMSCVFFHQMCPSIVSKSLADSYSVKESDLGIFSSLFFYPLAIMQIFAGPISSLISPALLLGGCHILCSLGSIICGYSQSLFVGCLGRFLSGLCCGCTFVSICKFTTYWFPLDWYSTMIGIILSFTGIGGILAQYPLAIFAEKFGWRKSFYIIGIFDCFLAILMLLFCRGKPEDRGYPPVNDIKSMKYLNVKDKFIELKRHIILIIKNRDFWLIFIYEFIKDGIYFDLAGLWAGPYFKDIFDYSNSKTGLILCGFTLGMTLGCFLAPVISKKLNTKKWSCTVTSTLAIIIFVFFIVWSKKMPFFFAFIFCFLLGFLLNGFTCVAFDYIRDYFPPEIASNSIGLANFACFLGGAIFQNISSIIIPWSGHFEKKDGSTAYKETGYIHGVWLLGVIGLCLAISFLLFSDEKKAIKANELQQDIEAVEKNTEFEEFNLNSK